MMVVSFATEGMFSVLSQAEKLEIFKETVISAHSSNRSLLCLICILCLPLVKNVSNNLMKSLATHRR